MDAFWRDPHMAGVPVTFFFEGIAESEATVQRQKRARKGDGD
jgi:hypothetical protein